MDLAAFLQPGRIYPFAAEAAGDAEFRLPAEKTVWGRLWVRGGGRLSWVVPLDCPRADLSQAGRTQADQALTARIKMIRRQLDRNMMARLQMVHPPGRRLDLTLTVSGLSQDPDGGLRPADHPEALLELRLLALVTACRPWPPHGGLVLRLKLLGRLIGA